MNGAAELIILHAAAEQPEQEYEPAREMPTLYARLYFVGLAAHYMRYTAFAFGFDGGQSEPVAIAAVMN